jgi:hypothetical protein
MSGQRSKYFKEANKILFTIPQNALCRRKHSIEHPAVSSPQKKFLPSATTRRNNSMTKKVAKQY